MDAVRNSTLFNRLKESSEAVEAISRLGTLLQNAGIDPSKPPSKMQLMKLAMNSEIRAEFVAVMEQLRNSGVDLTSPEVQEEMKAIVAKAQEVTGTK
ncbi:hypothetical protein BDV98DRAFT_569206 [Pterulicium gracile]|uniref:Uncharacterized protein n=1 Tax=Pterulicium gracile TaxID=1884261 RepID=A0A5C3QGE9_9AGAR|nr:hypothetical protein BDV98DRAFT_569206 [Pterula gracilis]